MYELLGQIYKEILEIFDTDVVHMGGDEVRDSLLRDFPYEGSTCKNFPFVQSILRHTICIV